MLSISWKAETSSSMHVYWAPGATVPRHTCTGAMPMREARRTMHAGSRWQRVCTRTNTAISRGEEYSTGGLNWESAPWKHGILEANKLITAGGRVGCALRLARPHEKKKTWNGRVWPDPPDRVGGVACRGRTSGWCAVWHNSPIEVKQTRDKALTFRGEGETAPASGPRVSVSNWHHHIFPVFQASDTVMWRALR
jgi:hypothetical protein